MRKYIYVVSRNIDGFGGRLKDEYFYKFKDAKNCVAKTSGVFLSADGKWGVEGMAGCRASETFDCFTLDGIPQSKENRNEFSIDFCEIMILPVILDFDITDDTIFKLKLNVGYSRHLENQFNNIIGEDNFSNIGLFKSEADAMAFANEQEVVKHIAKLWVESDENRISSTGGAEDYLSIEKIKVN